ncbi:hypothetical protein GCM10025858_36460 [Alicyclobacillus sacchari]|nr:hypothetical protein GCM10025858_36460 [Alicyclobacillus sacchari]
MPEAVPEPPSFEEQMEVVFDEAVPVFSFTFGIPTPAVMDACSKQGIATIGTATTVEEAIEIERAGASAVVVQGAEAAAIAAHFSLMPNNP